MMAMVPLAWPLGSLLLALSLASSSAAALG